MHAVLQGVRSMSGAADGARPAAQNDLDLGASGAIVIKDNHIITGGKQGPLYIATRPTWAATTPTPTTPTPSRRARPAGRTWRRRPPSCAPGLLAAPAAVPFTDSARLCSRGAAGRRSLSARARTAGAQRAPLNSTNPTGQSVYSGPAYWPGNGGQVFTRGRRSNQALYRRAPGRPRRGPPARPHAARPLPRLLAAPACPSR